MNPRPHVSFPVSDLVAAVAFYEKLFETAPTKLKPGYAKFLPTRVSLNFSMIEGRPAKDHGATEHYGIEYPNADEVEEARKRFVAAGLVPFDEGEVECCYSRQQKFWLRDPDGRRWEVFSVMQDSEHLAPVAAGAPAGEEKAERGCCAANCCT